MAYWSGYDVLKVITLTVCSGELETDKVKAVQVPGGQSERLFQKNVFNSLDVFWIH
jgi:hypothetical protein